MASEQILVELEALREANDGLLLAEDVVNFAHDNPDSALHARFEWDDSIASHQFRLQQARGVIRMFVSVLPRSTQVIRAYVSLMADRTQPGGGYRSMGEVMGNQERRQMLLAQALREAQRFREKYEGLIELAGIFGEIDTAAASFLVAKDLLDLHHEAPDQVPLPPN